MSQRDNMSEKKIATPSVTRNLMQAHTIRAKKSLGQNFIIEPQVIDNIVTAAGCDKQDLVLEIGPGLGSLTQALSNAAGQVIALEIDQSLIPALEQSLAACANVRLLHADAMTADLPRILAEAYQASPNLRPGFMAVANLPYYITTPLLLRFLQQPDLPWRRLVFMVQKELAERMQAEPGSKDYGALSLAVQYRAKARLAFSVPPSVFLPRPKVASAVIVLERLAAPCVQPADENLFFSVIRAGFNQRRKTLPNSLSSVLQLPKEQVNAALAAAGVALERRAETLTMAEFARLADEIKNISG